MRYVKAAALACAAAVCAGLTGCGSSAPLNVDGLLAAPKLSDEQTEIHETLTASVGSNIQLKYPKNGDRRSAFVIGDIDTEPTDEALVFYERKDAPAGEGGIRVNVLDRNDSGNWESVYDLAGKGTDVDRVAVSTLGRDRVNNIIVGYLSMNMDEKYLQISSYDKKAFNSSRFEDTYSIMEVFDIDKDGFNEVVTALNNAADNTASASVIEAVSDKIEKTDTVAMSADTTGFVNSTVGLVDKETPGMFVDCLKSNGTLRTEIIYYRYGKLQDPLVQIPDKLLEATARPAGYYCMDVDKDDIVEIPSAELMPGHESLEPEEQLYLTSWWSYEDYYTLSKKYTGYYSISGGYSMMFPKRWQNVVTAMTDKTSGEVVFYKYDGSMEGYMTELMRVAVCPRSERDDYLFDGYEMIGSEGQRDYMVKLPTNRKEPLILTMDEVEHNFYIV